MLAFRRRTDTLFMQNIHRRIEAKIVVSERNNIFPYIHDSCATDITILGHERYCIRCMYDDFERYSQQQNIEWLAWVGILLIFSIRRRERIPAAYAITEMKWHF